uniref:Uncharacterized protein n=1 Tax=Anguilla anguilla TaxID=7936 RepID=A0A0E9WSP8_ANGAN
MNLIVCVVLYIVGHFCEMQGTVCLHQFFLLLSPDHYSLLHNISWSRHFQILKISF